VTAPFPAAARAIRRLGITFAAVGDRRWSDPPRVMSVDPRPSNRSGISTPTFDTVADERRWHLSATMSDAEAWLRRVTAEADAHATAIADALAAWNNDPKDDADGTP